MGISQMRKTTAHKEDYKSKADLLKEVKTLQKQLGLIPQPETKEPVEVNLDWYKSNWERLLDENKELLSKLKSLEDNPKMVKHIHEATLVKGSFCNCMCHWKKKCDNCVCNKPI